MITYILLFSTIAGISWADSSQPILTQISDGNNQCKEKELYGGFDLQTVPQFNALCNIPVPDIKQSEFLLENNVVPILCMGLMDVSFRLCKSAKDDISPFKDIFPPTADKFSNIFIRLSKSSNFSSVGEFCSMTVKQFAIKEAASNVTELWWEVFNKQVGDEKHCSAICHSNEENKVHPLCSFIMWSNGIFANNQKNKVVEQVHLSEGEEETPPLAQKVDKTVDQGEISKQDNGSIVKNNIPVPNKPTEVDNSPDQAPITSEKSKTEPNKSNLTAEDNNVGVGTVEQVVNNDETAIADVLKTETNPPVEVEEPKKPIDTKSKKYQIKVVPTAPNITTSVSAGTSNTLKDKPVPAINQAEDKTQGQANAVGDSLSAPETQGSVVGVPTTLEHQKQVDTDTKLAEPGKANEGMAEDDFSLEVTPGVNMDQPIPVDNFQSPDPDEEAEDGDGDDVDINESNFGVSNSSNPAASKAGNTGSVVNIQQSPLEGDRVYGEGEILIEDHFIEAEDSHFFTYFLCMGVLTIMAYLAFHNKKKLIALAVEGRRSKGGRRRPNSSHYSKLDCSLEEALVSNTTASVTHVLY